MAKCMYCGADIDDGLTQCPFCDAALPIEATVEDASSAFGQMPEEAVATAAGAAVNQAFNQPPAQPQAQQGYVPPSTQAMPDPAYQQSFGQQPEQPSFPQPNGGQPVAAPVDSGHIGWGVLGFFFPIVGWILYFVWKNTKPQTAKVAGIGGLIGFALNIVLTLMF